MDVVVAVLAKLFEDENPFVCEEEIEDLDCMRMVVLGEIRFCYEERMKSVVTKADDVHNAVGGKRKTGQDKVASGQEELCRGCIANETAPGTQKSN